MSKIAAVLVLLPLAGCTLDGTVAEYPTESGTYKNDGWKYVYSIEFEGTRSEARIGKLYQNGKEVSAPLGTIKSTPVGRFMHCSHQDSDQGFNRGWLNTSTYDKPVFEQDGSLTKKEKRRVDLLKNNTE